MNSKYNIIRKKVELLRMFRQCTTEKQFIDLNNAVVVPLYGQVKKYILDREKQKDFSEVKEGEFYLSDFNFIYDCEYFLEFMHNDIQSELSDLHFKKHGWTSIAV